MTTFHPRLFDLLSVLRSRRSWLPSISVSPELILIWVLWSRSTVWKFWSWTTAAWRINTTYLQSRLWEPWGELKTWIWISLLELQRNVVEIKLFFDFLVKSGNGKPFPVLLLYRLIVVLVFFWGALDNWILFVNISKIVNMIGRRNHLHDNYHILFIQIHLVFKELV
jgi:hypothetical protein